jgi:murein DD-endopeptidase MepM/ murein hydrolase activator NlpD
MRVARQHVAAAGTLGALIVLSVVVVLVARGDKSAVERTASGVERVTSTTVAAPMPSGHSATSTLGPTVSSTVLEQPLVYRFPIEPSTDASYGRSHHDYPATDIFAACGTPYVAVISGRVDEVTTVDIWNSNEDAGATRGGLSVSIVGVDGVRYYGSHLRSISPAIHVGDDVVAGSALGEVGETGNARGVGCHLHFGISTSCHPGDWEVRRGVIAPATFLDAWKSGRLDSPAADVAAWKKSHLSECRVTGGSGG